MGVVVSFIAGGWGQSRIDKSGVLAGLFVRTFMSGQIVRPNPKAGYRIHIVEPKEGT
jgi:hypothetical protein